MRAREPIALVLLGVIVLATAAWWALALWPLPDAAPAWLARTRWVCFGSAPQGLPNAGGWLLLIGQPISMVAALWVMWGDAVRDGLRRVAHRAAGRTAMACTVVAVAAGLTAAGVRVAGARDRGVPSAADPGRPARLDRPAPALALVDQHGQPFALAQVAGRPAIVAFTFAHCTTICPLIVREVLRARELAADASPAIVIVTVDPWRDTPARLPAIARHWALPPDAVLLSGPVAEVERVLAAWDVPITRDQATGDVSHPGLVYVLDRSGRQAFAAPGDAELLARLLQEP